MKNITKVLIENKINYLLKSKIFKINYKLKFIKL